MALRILFWVISAPPLLYAVAAALIYVGLAGGHWRWAMLPDAALLALYLYVPSVSLLLWLVLLCAVRHTPALACEFAAALGLDRFGGWTVQISLFLLPGCADVTTSAPVIQAAESGPASALLPIIPSSQWMRQLNADETAPMTGVVGPTRFGKTTFVLAFMSQRAGSFVVTTPKDEASDPWGDLPVVRPTMDLGTRAINWAPVAQAISDVHFEMLRRYQQNSVAQSEWLTLVIDEFATTIGEITSVRKKVHDLWRMAAGARIRVIVIAPDVNVRSWGVEGRRDILDNLIFAKVGAGRAWEMGRIDPNGRLIDPRKLDTRDVWEMAQRVQLSARGWSGLRSGLQLQTAAGGLSALSGHLTAPSAPQTTHRPPQTTPQTVPSQSAATGPTTRLPSLPPRHSARLAAPAPVPAAPVPPPTSTPAVPQRLPSAPDHVYREIILSGVTRSQGEVEMNRRGYRLDNNRWTAVRKQLITDGLLTK